MIKGNQSTRVCCSLLDNFQEKGSRLSKENVLILSMRSPLIGEDDHNLFRKEVKVKDKVKIKLDENGFQIELSSTKSIFAH